MTVPPTTRLGRPERVGAKVLQHVVNLGQGATLQTGVEYGLSIHAEAIVMFDADGQMTPDDIPKFLATLERGADVALGSRFLGEVVGVTQSRARFLKWAVRVSNIISGLSLSDAHCGFRAFRASVAPNLRITQDRMAHASELLHLIRRHRLHFEEVPVTIRYTEYSRTKGQSGFQAIRILFDYWFRHTAPPK